MDCSKCSRHYLLIIKHLHVLKVEFSFMYLSICAYYFRILNFVLMSYLFDRFQGDKAAYHIYVHIRACIGKLCLEPELQLLKRYQALKS